MAEEELLSDRNQPMLKFSVQDAPRWQGNVALGFALIGTRVGRELILAESSIVGVLLIAAYIALSGSRSKS